ncbi:MAG: DnaJ domain-containing protein [Kofleriaceae bacterium]|nr:DnaJ domain-containing protein [Kofleriaceae bacterium]
MSMNPPSKRLERGEFASFCYQLGQTQSTGVLSIQLSANQAELLILRRGQVFTRDSDALGRETRQRLERIASSSCIADFDSGLAAYPPSLGRPFSLVDWARQHLEAQIDSARAQRLAGELAGVRLRVNIDRLPINLDATDKRIVTAMSLPRRLDQIWPLARAPRFRLMAFVHFLRSVGALHESGVAAAQYRPLASGSDKKSEAMRTLGLLASADHREIKRAYRKLARSLHPDLNSGQSLSAQRAYERRLVDVNSAYRELTRSPA